ncbi:merR HTH regulatory family protein [Collimonas fungivorans]|jgi:chaperone modulatory protein CbpM|uniref:MerR HTH regulatory family protein n=1 Tax=Collimonas fungivorans TaxID=158899 RepID=A0A127PE18_9BURK|nr:chaperone modulator CbpM [Collimonas fungivorans]AMO95681.1 merR HTH regulatory family protein [Collimonas fungivorans]
MTALLVEAVWLNDIEVCSLDELAEFSGLSHDELAELVAIGAIEPDRNTASSYVFRAQTIVLARTARRLRDDFELDTHGVAMALNLLQKIHTLEARLAAVDAKLPHLS